MRNKIDWIGLGIFASFFAIVACVVIPICAAARLAEDKRHTAYNAWVKLTDNPKHLTYEEWRALFE